MGPSHHSQLCRRCGGCGAAPRLLRLRLSAFGARQAAPRHACRRAPRLRVHSHRHFSSLQLTTPMQVSDALSMSVCDNVCLSSGPSPPPSPSVLSSERIPLDSPRHKLAFARLCGKRIPEPHTHCIAVNFETRRRFGSAPGICETVRDCGGVSADGCVLRPPSDCALEAHPRVPSPSTTPEPDGVALASTAWVCLKWGTDRPGTLWCGNPGGPGRPAI